MCDFGSWFDTHRIIVYALLGISILCIFASWAGFLPKATLPWIIGGALGGVGTLLFLRWYRADLLKEIAAIQEERNDIGMQITENETELKNAGVTSAEEVTRLETKGDQLVQTMQVWDQADAAAKKNRLIIEVQREKDKAMRNAERKRISGMSAQEVFNEYRNTYPEPEPNAGSQ